MTNQGATSEAKETGPKFTLFGRLGIDELVFGGMMGLSYIGVAITHANSALSHLYWITMVPILGAICLFTEWSRARGEGIPWTKLLRTKLFHWGGLLVAVQLVNLLVRTGRMSSEPAALVILLLVAFSTFLEGVYIDWRFLVVGLFLALSLVFIAFVQQYTWILLFIAIAVVAIGIFIIRRGGAVTADRS